MKKLFIALLFAVVFSGCKEVYAENVIDKMKATVGTNPVIVCNTFAVAFANGVYDYGLERTDFYPPSVGDDPEERKLYADLRDSGYKSAEKYLADKGLPRGYAIELASDVGTELEGKCSMTGGNRVILDTLPNLGEYSKQIINEVYNAPKGKEI